MSATVCMSLAMIMLYFHGNRFRCYGYHIFFNASEDVDGMR